MNETQQTGWWRRLTGGLKRTSSSIGTAIADLMMRGPLAPERIVEIEETLIRADLGGTIAARIAAQMGEGRYDKAISDEVQGVLAAEVEKVLAPVARPLAIAGARPFVMLVVGRQRLGQDHDHRQARGKIPRRGPQGRAGARATRSAPPRSIS